MRQNILGYSAIVLALLLCGCSTGGVDRSPVAPAAQDSGTSAVRETEQSQTYLWGYYDVYLDTDEMTVTVVPNRSAEFAVNIVKFLNSSATNLGISFNGAHAGSGYVDVDLDVTIKHPFSGKPEFNGYDVRGIFLGNGSEQLDYYDLGVSDRGVNDQVLYDFNEVVADPHAGLVGNPDGYTRWWNPTEFTSATIFGYYPGMLASKGYSPTARVNAYKYFADGLDVEDDVVTFLENTSGDGVFSSGAENTRNYYLRFPKPAPGVKFAYAVVANWESTTVHPSNAPEAVAVSVTVTDDIYYVSPTDSGGDLILDITLFGWKNPPSGIAIESSVLSSEYSLNPTEMIPTATGTNWWTYHTEIPADSIDGVAGNEFWVIAQYSPETYENPFGIPNGAGTDPLASFFRNDLWVSPTPYNQPPVIDSGVDGNAFPQVNSTEIYNVDANDPDGDSLSYSWTVTDKANGMPDPSYDGVPGDGAGNLTIVWGNISGVAAGKQYDISCTVTDGKSAPVPAVTLTASVGCPAAVPIAIDPAGGGIATDVVGATITVDGNLVAGASLAVQLILDDTIIDGTSVAYVDPTHLTADFALYDVPLGDYMVMVTNGCGTQASSAEGLFTIVCGGPVPYSMDPFQADLDTIVYDAHILVSGGLVEGPSLAVSLIQGPTEIVGQNIEVYGPDEMIADFYLFGAPLGDYFIEVTNGCGTQATSDSPLFEVTCPAPTAVAISPPSGFEGFSVLTHIMFGDSVMDGPSLDAALVPTGGGTEIPASTVQWLSGVQINASFDLPPGSTGDYFVKVTNGCGTIHTADTFVFTVEPTKNILVSTADFAADLCIDPTTDDILVLYLTGMVKRFALSSCYSSFTDIDGSFAGVEMKYIDCADDGSWHLVGLVPASPNVFTRHYDTDDQEVIYLTSGLETNGSIVDAYEMPSWSNQPDAHSWATIYLDDPNDQYHTAVLGWLPPDYFTDNYFCTAVTSSLLTGPQYLYQSSIRAVEADPVSEGLWIVGGWDYWYASRWRMDYGLNQMNYASAFFGNGTAVQEDTGLYDALDISAAKDNHMYVLDMLSGSSYRIKAFDAGNGNAFVPGVDADSSVAVPKRIDGSTESGILAMVSTYGQNTYLSIYPPSELP